MSSQRGITLVEVLVTMALITALVGGLLATFGGIQRSVQRTKARTLAIALCRELMETLKSQKYPLLRPTSQADLDAFGYDATYFPAELSLQSGNLRFSRYNKVTKVAIDGSGRAMPLPPDGPDAGLKQVDVWVTWTEAGRQVRYAMSSLVDNPARTLPQGAISGTIYQDPGGPGHELSGVRVLIEQNSSLRDVTGPSGAYRITTTTGAFTLQAKKRGYFSSRAAVAANPDATQDFTLVARGSGTISGFAYVRDHPLISRVVVSTTEAGFEAQFVELYNPTTAPVLVAALGLRYRAPAPPYDCPTMPLTFVSPTLPPDGFYLIANAASFESAGSSVTADAYFSDAAAGSCLSPPPGWAPPAQRRLLQPLQAGSLALVDGSGAVVDLVGWTAGATIPAPCEGSCLSTPAGLGAGQQLVRLSTPALPSGSGAPSYDSDDNAVDLAVDDAVSPPPRTSTSAPWAPLTGTPAVGAVVSADDDLSSPVTVSSSTGWFSLPGVASCTDVGAAASWDVTAASGTAAGTLSLAAPAGGATADAGALALVVASSAGVVTGQVVSSTGAALPGVVVACEGVNAVTDAGGAYRLVVPAATGLTAQANPAHANATLSMALSPPFDLAPGGVVSAVDFSLDNVGRIDGVVTTDGSNPYPGALVEADAPAGTLRGTASADASGCFDLADLPVSAEVGDYSVFPVLDDTQASAPASQTATVVAGLAVSVASFTVSRALGTITGSVSDGGMPVATGVLILASQASLGASPPAWDESLRAGSTYYYSTLTRSDGSYELPVRVSGAPYNVYAWYTKATGDTATVTLLKTATQVVSAPSAYTVSFTWP